MVNYQNGKIYRIISDYSGLQYIGSTCQKLSVRMSGHRSDYKSFLEGKNPRVTSFKVLEQEDAQIILIENFPCNSKEELLRRERYYIETMVCVNKQIPLQTREQYYELNRELICDKRKLYVRANREEVIKKKKLHREANLEAYAKKNKQRYESNKEVCLVKAKEYRDSHKEQIEKYRKNITLAKIQCECGSQYSKYTKERHEQTMRHKKFLEAQSTQEVKS